MNRRDLITSLLRAWHLRYPQAETMEFVAIYRGGRSVRYRLKPGGELEEQTVPRPPAGLYPLPRLDFWRLRRRNGALRIPYRLQSAPP